MQVSALLVGWTFLGPAVPGTTLPHSLTLASSLLQSSKLICYDTEHRQYMNAGMYSTIWVTIKECAAAILLCYTKACLCVFAVTAARSQLCLVRH